MKSFFSIFRTVIVIVVSIVALEAMGQNAQTSKQSLPEQPGYVLQNGTVYMIDRTMTLDGNSTGGFINGLAVAENATVTLYIPAGVTLRVIGQNADGQHPAGAGIYVPASSTLYITGEGRLEAIGGNGGNGGNGGDGGAGVTAGSEATSGKGGDGGYGGGGAGAAIGGNGGAGGDIVTGGLESKARKRKGTTGANGNPMMNDSEEYLGKNGANGGGMGNVYILGSVTVVTTKGSGGVSGGAAGAHGAYKSSTSGNVTLSSGGGGAGAGGGAGMGASYGIGGGGGGAGSGAAGASGAADRYDGKNLTFNDDNMKGSGGSATGAGEGAVNGNVITTGDMIRDSGADPSGRFPRYGGYGGTVGGKAGAQGDNGFVYIEHDSEAILTNATIGNLITLSESEVADALAALNVSIKLNFLNDGDPNSGVLHAQFGEHYTQLPQELIPTRAGYDFVGYFDKAVGGNQVFDKGGNPTPEGIRCTYVQEENPTLYAHWILSKYTITWKYEYYSVDEGGMVEIPVAERSYQANVIIRLTDGSTYNMMMENPQKSLKEYTHTVTLRNELTDEIFNKVVSVEKVEPVEIPEADVSTLMTLDYVSESSAKIFYDPTRYMVKWDVSVTATEKPEYIILSVKRGITDETADGNIPTDGDYAEDPNVFHELRIRQNANGRYSGSAVLKYEQDASHAFHYSVSVAGVRDNSGHEYMFPAEVSSKEAVEGIMYCSKPSDENPNPTRNIECINFNIELKQLTFAPNGGTLDDGSPENIWTPAGSYVVLKDGTDYPYTATRMNYHFEGWAETPLGTESLEGIDITEDRRVYAIFMDRTPPTITFGEYSRNGAANNYRVPVTISDAISTENVVYYAVYDTNPGDIPVDDPRWGTQKGKTQKKAEVVNIDFTTTSVVYVHVKAVDESLNAAVASKEIKVDTEAPVIHAYPNVDSFCATDVDVDVMDNVGITNLTVDPSVAITNDGNTRSLVLTKPTSGSKVYTITAEDAAGNTTVRTITIYAAHNFPSDESTMVAATEPTATSEGYYRYKRCNHCSHIILLHGDTSKEIDITDETQRTAWIIPKGAVMLMTPYNEGLDIIDFDTYVNAALTKTNTVTSATQVRLSKDTPLANSTTTSFIRPNRSIELELNGHGLLTSSNSAGNITGNSNVTILLSDANNRRDDFGGRDEIAYSNASNVSSASPVLYKRKFSDTQSGKWQAIYLPFSASVPNGLSAASIRKATNENGDATIEVVTGVTTLAANTPYLIQGSGNIEISGGSGLGAYVAPTRNIVGGESGFEVCGSLKCDDNVAVADYDFWVVTNGGKFNWVKAGGSQRPYRWVIYTGSANAKSLTFSFVEPDATGIKDVNTAIPSDKVYTIDGRRMQKSDKLEPGIYIVGGKKIVIR